VGRPGAGQGTPVYVYNTQPLVKAVTNYAKIRGLHDAIKVGTEKAGIGDLFVIALTRSNLLANLTGTALSFLKKYEIDESAQKATQLKVFETCKKDVERILASPDLQKVCKDLDVYTKKLTDEAKATAQKVRELSEKVAKEVCEHNQRQASLAGGWGRLTSVAKYVNPAAGIALTAGLEAVSYMDPANRNKPAVGIAFKGTGTSTLFAGSGKGLEKFGKVAAGKAVDKAGVAAGAIMALVDLKSNWSKFD